MTSRKAVVAFVTALAIVRAAPARADDTPIAESLFQQGLTAMERGDYTRACRLLGESQHLDPGGGTLLNLALCHEREGKVATAWARYHDALGIARRDARDDRITFAAEHIKLLEPRLPRLAISMNEPVAGAHAKVDGVDLSATVWETPSPIDPGQHVLRVEAPGHAPWTMTVAVAEAETRRVTVPRLAAVTMDTPGPVPAPGRRQRILGWSLTGVGGSALIAGAVLGALAIGAESTADASCPGTGACSDPRGLDASSRARAFSTAATISAIGGAVVLAGGIVLLLTAPSSPSASTAR